MSAGDGVVMYESELNGYGKAIRVRKKTIWHMTNTRCYKTVYNNASDYCA